jgi:hypothetical protein
MERIPLMIKVRNEHTLFSFIAKFKWNPWILARIMLACIFLLGAAQILLHFSAFEEVLSLTNILPTVFVRILGVLIAVSVSTAGLCALIPTLQEIASRLAIIEGSIFLSYVIWEWVAGAPHPANAFGSLFNLLPWQAILINIYIIWLSEILKLHPSQTASFTRGRSLK